MLRWKLVDQRQITHGSIQANTVVRFTLPATWRRLVSTDARPRFRTGTYSCVLRVTVRDRVIVGAAVPASARLAQTLPPKTPHYLLDVGTRGTAAWRVVRTRGAAMVGRFAIRSQRIEKRLGRTVSAVWHEIDMTTDPSGECHAGHYREAGARIGDALASLEREAYPRT
jgi:hypothetical protein